MTMKSVSLKGQGCKSGRWVAKAVVPTSGGLGLEHGVQEVSRHWLGGVACRLWNMGPCPTGGRRVAGLGRGKVKRKGSTPYYLFLSQGLIALWRGSQ